MKLKTCEVGMFRLPGIIVEDDEDENKTKVSEEQLKEMEEWCNSEFGTGVRMTDRLFSFRKESQRDWFILKWSGND
ncbi:MAG: hypothetical protein EBT86_13030 [Actinobacteria bacterium]|jgi:hypothetical protein|nr:hypothetical protein [Actinomycetota bacterium]